MFDDGDPERIKHLARRVTDVYADLLNWAARLRGITVPDEYRTLYELAGSFVDRPLRQMRDFVDAVVEEADRMPEMLRTGETIHVTLTLKVDIDEEILRQFTDEAERLSD